ncbi:hypothetical protein AC578_1384 [Pseudocercospora eumusae]|uniref:DASH complex subunit Hsk3 like-domain-containing protein n=1 Tax=Pseudocercospora eumusae TaxID=321146 RepID=A0A139HUX3_9PEZI|nr:hypothetical protein AC578_1384 [Pseudocercospora eumusae]
MLFLEERLGVEGGVFWKRVPQTSRLLFFRHLTSRNFEAPKMSTNSNPTRTPGQTRSQSTSNRLSTVPTSASKSRQLSHLHAQLAQLTANMSDLENLLRMTAVQAEGMRGLGGYVGGMFMAASKVLGEETVQGGGSVDGKEGGGK